MKTIGTWIPQAASSSCTSSPLRSGRFTSRTTHAGASSRHLSRNWRAVVNASTRRPAEETSPCTDSRTETSSSTTWTTAAASLMADLAFANDAKHPPPAEEVDDTLVSAVRQRELDRVEQRGLAERLQEAIDHSCVEQAGTQVFAAVGGDEYDRDRLSPAHQFLMQGGSGHRGHRDVEDQAIGLVDESGSEELLRRRERARGVAERLQQVRERLAHGQVVVDDRDQRWRRHAMLRSAERERKDLCSRIEELHLESAIDDGLPLPDELIQPRLPDCTHPFRVDVDTVGGARRLAVDEDAEPDRRIPRRRRHDEIDVAGMEAVRDAAAPIGGYGGLAADRPGTRQRPVIERDLCREFVKAPL